MNTIYSIFKQLESTRSRNEKLSILKQNSNNQTLKRVFKTALDPNILFYMKKLPKVDTPSLNTLYSIDESLDALEQNIASRKITGNNAITFVKNILSMLSEEERNVVSRVILKKPDCGVEASTVNEVWKDLIPVYPCLLSSPFTEGILNGFDWEHATESEKYDGKRTNIIIDPEGNVSVVSREGFPMVTHGRFDFIASSLKGYMLDGELIAMNPDGTFMNRETSNGIAGKAAHGTITKEESDTLHFVMWDCVPYDKFKEHFDPTPFKQRFQNLNFLFGYIPQNNALSIAEHTPVKNLDEVLEKYEARIKMKKEGSMLKCGLEPWSDTRSKKIIKFKETRTADMKVTGWIDGEGFLKGNLGALTVKSSDDLIEVNMSGFKLDVRSKIYANLTGKDIPYKMVVDKQEKTFVAKPGEIEVSLDSIIEIKYNNKTKDKKTGVYSLFLPRFSCVRDDKTVANSFEEIK